MPPSRSRELAARDGVMSLLSFLGKLKTLQTGRPCPHPGPGSFGLPARSLVAWPHTLCPVLHTESFARGKVTALSPSALGLLYALSAHSFPVP